MSKININRETKRRLKELARIGESYDDVIVRLMMSQENESMFQGMLR